MRVYGVCNHSPDYVYVWLKKQFKIDSIQILAEAELLGDKPTKKVIFFLTHLSLRRNLPKINSKPYDNCVGVVFSNPVDISTYSGVEPLDFSLSKDIHIDAFILEDLCIARFIVEKSTVKIERNKINYLDLIMQHVRSFDSLLNPLMTFIYTLPSFTHQKPIKEILCRWLYSSESNDDLEKTLSDKSVSIPLTEKQRARLRDIMNSELSSKYKRALNKYKKSKVKDEKLIKELVDEFNVSAYELRYIISISTKTKG